MKRVWQIGLIILLWMPGGVAAASLDDIPNYVEYSEFFSSSGQPTVEQIPQLAAAGFRRVIYLAYTTNQTAILGEDKLVLGNGMDYVHIPVEFSNPTLKNFQLAVKVLQDDVALKTLLHCQINLRASTFSFLYRTIFLKVPMAVAKVDLDAIWVPDKTWYKFIVDTLAHYGMNADCDDCDWGEREFD